MDEPIEDRGFAQIKSRYYQAHIVRCKYNDVVFVPGFQLGSDWTHNICTVLFEKPAGFPAARCANFWVDIPNLRLAKDMSHPYCSNGNNPVRSLPHWKDLTWFLWKPQMWDPNRDSLFTWLMCIRMRLKPAR